MSANARLDFAVMQVTRHDRLSPREYTPPPLKSACSLGEFQRAVSDNRDRYIEQSRLVVNRPPVWPSKKFER